MSNHEAMTPTGESSVSDQGHLVAETASHDRASRAQHLAHARTAARSFVSNHDHVAGFHLAGEDRRGGALFAIEHASGAGEAQAFLAGNLGDCAFRREVAVHHHEVAVLLDRIGERTNDVLARWVVTDVAQVFRERAAGDGQAITVQQSRIEQSFHQGLNSPDCNELGH